MVVAPDVIVIMGSKSDWPVMKRTVDLLEELGVAHEARVLSAHRTPAETAEYVRECESRGAQVFICAAGGAAHLAGAVAAQTVLPVIGVPLASSDLDGLDALLATVQMPRGVPVATVAIGNAGASNAALLAASILSTARPELKEKLQTRRAENRRKILSEKLE